MSPAFKMVDTLKKIGIITHYYKSRNYGGNLQAYALCRFLSGEGFQAEQISYHMSTMLASPPPKVTSRLKKLLQPKKVLDFVTRRVAGRLLRGRFDARYATIDRFNRQQIPHSETVYTAQTIDGCDGYDAYITGSDQVWNIQYEPAFYLRFVPSGRPRISYGASLGRASITAKQGTRFREDLADFAAVSVREGDAARLLRPLVPVPVQQVLDPTLLLTREQWDEVCSARLVEGRYLFAYFLGDSTAQRKAAKAFAQRRGLSIVTLPYLEDVFRICDFSFGDRKLYAVSPADFISLIKHADYIFTDSFHGAVFSSLYGKEYYVFQRAGHPGMASRIYSLTALFKSGDHFCDTPEKTGLSYIDSLPPIDYARPLPELETMRNRSMDFLRKNLSGIK